MGSILGGNSHSKQSGQNFYNSSSQQLSGSQNQSQQNSTSSSGNYAYPTVSQGLSPVVGNTAQGSSMLGSLLGVNGSNAGSAALNNYFNSAGGAFTLDQGQKAVSGASAANGTFDSGATGKALEQYGQNLGSTYLNNYISNLSNYANLGLGASQALTGAGSHSQSNSSGASTGSSFGLGNSTSTGGGTTSGGSSSKQGLGI